MRMQRRSYNGKQCALAEAKTAEELPELGSSEGAPRWLEGQPANWANDESSPLLDDIVVFTASGQIRLLEANQISPDILNQLLGVLLNLVVEKFEASVTAQTRAHVFGNEKTLLVPSQYGEEVRDAANNLQEITWSVAVPPCPSQLVTIGEPVSEGQWLARITGTMADYRVGVIFEAGAPLPGANAQIAEQVAAFRAKLQENGWAELWSKIAAVQHGLFGVQTDRMLIEENAFRLEMTVAGYVPVPINWHFAPQPRYVPRTYSNQGITVAPPSYHHPPLPVAQRPPVTPCACPSPKGMVSPFAASPGSPGSSAVSPASASRPCVPSQCHSPGTTMRMTRPAPPSTNFAVHCHARPKAASPKVQSARNKPSFTSCMSRPPEAEAADWLPSSCSSRGTVGRGAGTGAAPPLAPRGSMPPASPPAGGIRTDDCAAAARYVQPLRMPTTTTVAPPPPPPPAGTEAAQGRAARNTGVSKEHAATHTEEPPARAPRELPREPPRESPREPRDSVR
ncbi:unnamed protein product [Durusdinium trenchii]|uniref:Uncharacterized protein n=1 Tax=Durusdinium trenchii TaxID=1381693 RepID=A0ABP0R0Q3_9DINO